MNVLKLIDAVDIGIEKEKARRDFYDLVSKSFDSGEVKALFERLRDWETGHIAKFESIKNNLDSHTASESYSGELAGYLNALVDDRLYEEVSPESFAGKVADPVEAIQYGIGFEKDAILLFQELIPFVQESSKEILQALIDEERQHIVYLMKLREKYG